MPNLRREIKAQYRQSRGRAEDIQRTQINGMGARCVTSEHWDESSFPSPSNSRPSKSFGTFKFHISTSSSPALRAAFFIFSSSPSLVAASRVMLGVSVNRMSAAHVAYVARLSSSMFSFLIPHTFNGTLCSHTNSEPTWNEPTTLPGRVIWDLVSHVSHLGVPSKLFLMNPASSLHISSKSPSSTHFHPGDSGPFSF